VRVRRQIRIRVAACVVDGERILLVQHRKAGRLYWLLPGGGVEVGETLVAALERELLEETGYAVEVGRLLIVCEALEPGGRHLLNLVYAGAITGGSLSVGSDGRLVAVSWRAIDDLATVLMYPPIAGVVRECCAEGLTGEVRVLGNVWSAEVGEGDYTDRLSTSFQ
jgi:ADP-ribose pyrophosphatase YjhB (NUDIX family)